MVEFSIVGSVFLLLLFFFLTFGTYIAYWAALNQAANIALNVATKLPNIDSTSNVWYRGVAFANAREAIGLNGTSTPPVGNAEAMAFLTGTGLVQIANPLFKAELLRGGELAYPSNICDQADIAMGRCPIVIRMTYPLPLGIPVIGQVNVTAIAAGFRETPLL